MSSYYVDSAVSKFREPCAKIQVQLSFEGRSIDRPPMIELCNKLVVLVCLYYYGITSTQHIRYLHKFNLKTNKNVKKDRK